MDYAKSIIRSILLESANQDDVIDAVKKRYSVEINYQPNDDDETGSGKRIIYPTCYGTSNKGNLIVDAYQPYGDTKSSVPNWKTFKLDSITSWNPKKETRFSEPPDFNPNGNGKMAQVYVIANFGDNAESEVNQNQKQDKRETPDYGIQRNNTRTAPRFARQTPPKINQKKGSNAQSIQDMARANAFGDENISQTTKPITKNQNDRNNVSDGSNTNDYTQAMNNGPVFKNTVNNIPDEEEYELDDFFNDNEEDNIENDERK